MTLTAVSEKPILFSEPMVRAILVWRKTQTRRIVKPLPHKSISYFEFLSTCFKPVWGGPELDEPDFLTLNKCIRCPYGGVGDSLWVREAWGLKNGNGETLHGDANLVLREFSSIPFAEFTAVHVDLVDGMHVVYRADGGECERWRPPIHMPRWASRLTLEITGVRVERVQDISAKDILAEGVVLRPHDDHLLGKSPISAFDGGCYVDLKSLWAAGWEKVNGKGAWQRNDWVWVVEFKRAEDQG